MAAWNCAARAGAWAGAPLSSGAEPESAWPKAITVQISPVGGCGCGGGWKVASVGTRFLGECRRLREARARANSSPVVRGEADARSVEGPQLAVQLRDGPRKPADVVREFYDLINRRDYIAVANLFADDCEYEDFTFPESKKGKEKILQFFQKVMSSFGTELKFVIDDMTTEDPSAVGVIWHLDWRGKLFPFSRGCSFYRLEVNQLGDQQIKFARDIVEPASKPGDISMGLLRLVTALFERFPKLADRL